MLQEDINKKNLISHILSLCKTTRESEINEHHFRVRYIIFSLTTLTYFIELNIWQGK